MTYINTLMLSGKYVKSPVFSPHESDNIYPHAGDKFERGSHGMRCEEWDLVPWSDSTWFIGDSNTYGIGIKHRSDTIPGQYASLKNEKVVNLGLPGASIYNMLEIATWARTRGRPKQVIIGHTYPQRFMDFFEDGWDGKVQQIRISSDIKQSKKLLLKNYRGKDHQWKRILYWTTREISSAWHWYMYTREILTDGIFRGVKCIEWIPGREEDFNRLVQEVTAIPYIGFIDTGSDNMHPGPGFAKKMAQVLVTHSLVNNN